MQSHSLPTVIAIFLALGFSGAQANSMFGYPSMGFGGFGNPGFASSPYGTHRTRRPHTIFRDEYHDEGDSFHYRLPCPPYEPMSASAWTDSGKGHFTTFVALPGVSSQNRHVWLGEDGDTVHLKAARSVPAQGLKCIPRDVQLSRDGRSEIFEANLILPHGSNADEATIRQVRGGVELNVPKLAIVTRQQSANAKRDEATNFRLEDRTIGSTSESFASTELAAPRVNSQQEAKFVLPYPSDGIEVSDEPYPEVIKNADAAQGYVDNRGEFHEY